MAPTKSNLKPKAKPIKRRSSRRKTTAPLTNQQDKENIFPSVRREDSPSQTITNGRQGQNWWRTNADKADKLIERCIEVYDWDRAKAKRIHGAYRQLLLLKEECGDWDETKLYPCWPIDKMWVLHSMLDDYQSDMTSLCGNVIKRVRTKSVNNPILRQKATREALKRRFGSYDEELWEDIVVSIIDQAGWEYRVLINQRERLLEPFLWHARQNEENIDKFSFIFDGKTISSDNFEQTPMMLGIGHDGRIEASITDHFGITFIAEDKKYERCYKIGKTKMISRIFDHFAMHELDTERSNLVFLFQKKRVFGYESLMMLNLKPRDNIIDVIKVESYKCENCVCCNSQLGHNEKKNTAKNRAKKVVVVKIEEERTASGLFSV